MYYQTIYGNTDKKDTKVRYQKLTEKHISNFGRATHFFSSPGRCELVGNHTDHNNGRVLVSAITQDIAAAVCKSKDNSITIYADNGVWKVDLQSLEVASDFGSTASLIRGVASGFKKNDFAIGGFCCTTNSTLPSASGLSSSAAFELLICQIFNHLFNDGKIEGQTLAKIAQYAENVHFGKPCGLLDQFGVALGGVQKIDFANLDKIVCQSCEMPPLSKNVLLIKTSQDHAGLTKEYAAIPADMKAVANQLGKNTLGEIAPEYFYGIEPSLPNSLSYDRARHFFAENRRVDQAFCALQNKDESSFLHIINQSGDSSRYLLKNCALPGETDSPLCHIIDTVKSFDETCALRVHGGGFRGGVLIFTQLSPCDPRLNAQFGEQNIITLQFRNTGSCRVDIEKLFQ